MARWAHGRLEVHADRYFSFTGFNAPCEDDLIPADTDWEHALTALGRDGWEMVAERRRVDSRCVMWFKKQVSPS